MLSALMVLVLTVWLNHISHGGEDQSGINSESWIGQVKGRSGTSRGGGTYLDIEVGMKKGTGQ